MVVLKVMVFSFDLGISAGVYGLLSWLFGAQVTLGLSHWGLQL